MQSPSFTPHPGLYGRRHLLALLAATPALALPAWAQSGSGDISAAERALFMRPHLLNAQPGQALQYGFRHAGSLDAPFDDRVTISLGARPEGGCCSASGQFLTAERAVQLPELPVATSNPVILYFLERDVREMQRLTKGQQNHFRKRIRVALAERAQIREVKLSWRGQPVEGSEISIAPYLDDPNRPRFERYAGKTYLFVLSEAVPGGVVALRTTVPGAAGTAEPLIEDTLTLDGAEPPTRARS
ncbi:hypothetical protein MW290_06900 [Aquincola tertiaricarbonis]|uniref:DUF3108 domain-containing protein n=1 Tax=Aquincola tertiaricarbonis TaxID=391953 RepID=A0ABY4S6H6_AQUTE|nr:hypothetical protein [Aquincola tertiaricarbonis]URI08290.1 hypothetical protein MW290_06900 [Aquincola tertiaricarbonis]